MNARTRSRVRWTAPVVALIGVFGIGAVPHILSTASAASPDLPPLTPAELLAKARTAQTTGLSGTITVDSELGLPSLSSLPGLGAAGASSLTSLLAGKHSVHVAEAGDGQVRFSTAAPLQETNWVRNGPDLWSYDSGTGRVVHFSLPNDTSAAGAVHTSVPDPAHETPAEFARELLDQVTPSTAVSVDATAYVAGRPVYELVLAPNDARSTVRDVRIAVDAATGLPLDVTVTAKSNGKLAFEVGFTDVSFATPDPSTFAFGPPPGSTTVEASSLTEFLQGGPARHRRDHVASTDPTAAAGPAATTTPDATPALMHAGADWTSVVLLPAGSAPAQLTALLNNVPSIAVGATHGRLLTTTLVSVLVLDDGRVAVGAVDGATLVTQIAALA
jgi:outer membrane lipoprotein-sorting protein